MAFGEKTNERSRLAGPRGQQPGTRAVLRHSRIAPNKVREVLDLIRNQPVAEAEDILRFSERDASFTVGKVLRSAVANAENNDGQDPEELYVAACFADEGTTIKRWRPRARGRATRIRKRTSHITVIVSRLPSDRLERLAARRRAEQLAQRSRRVAGARRSDDTRTRAERRRGVPIETPETDAPVDDEVDTATTGAVTTTDAPSAAEVAAEANAATGSGRVAEAEEDAGIVDATAGAVAASETAEKPEKPATTETEGTEPTTKDDK